MPNTIISTKRTPTSTPRFSGNRRARKRLTLALAAMFMIGSIGLLCAGPALATSTLSAAAVVRIEQNSFRLAYSGSWTTVASASASGGSFALARFLRLFGDHPLQRHPPFLDRQEIARLR